MKVLHLEIYRCMECPWLEEGGSPFAPTRWYRCRADNGPKTILGDDADLGIPIECPLQEGTK